MVTFVRIFWQQPPLRPIYEAAHLTECKSNSSVPPNILVCPGWSAWAALLNTRTENKNILVLFWYLAVQPRQTFKYSAEYSVVRYFRSARSGRLTKRLGSHETWASKFFLGNEAMRAQSSVKITTLDRYWTRGLPPKAPFLCIKWPNSSILV